MSLVYTNFRSLISVLSAELRPLRPGEVHSEEEVAVMIKRLSEMRFNAKEFTSYSQYAEGSYTRSLVGFNVEEKSSRSVFTVLCLTWAPNQSSPIHNHAGSSCFVKVLKGKVREVRYEIDEASQMLQVQSDNIYREEEACFINDTMGFHEMGNPSETEIAITLHVYCPPYMLCKIFSREKRADEFQTGSMQVVETQKNPTHKLLASPAKTPRLADFDSDDSNQQQGKNKKRNTQLPLDEFLLDLKNVLANPDGDRNKIIEVLLKRLHLKDTEWKELCHFDSHRYSRALVALDNEYSMMLMCWNMGQGTPIHSHKKNTTTFVRVLTGTLTLKKYADNNNELASTKSYAAGSVISTLEFSGKHQIVNEGPPAVSIHVYNPPLVSMAYRDPINMREVNIPVIHTTHSKISSKSLFEVYGGSIFVNVKEFVEEAGGILAKGENIQEKLHDIMRRSEFNIAELKEVLGTRKQAEVAKFDDYAITLHDKNFVHQSLTGWIKVVNGSLTYKAKEAGVTSTILDIQSPNAIYIANPELEYSTPSCTMDNNLLVLRIAATT